VVGTTHIFWDYRRPALQALQASAAASAVLNMAGHPSGGPPGTSPVGSAPGGGGGVVPALLGGDFNSQPTSAAYLLLRHGKVRIELAFLARPGIHRGRERWWHACLSGPSFQAAPRRLSN
jgi:hypothetical protein